MLILPLLRVDSICTSKDPAMKSQWNIALEIHTLHYSAIMREIINILHDGSDSENRFDILGEDPDYVHAEIDSPYPAFFADLPQTESLIERGTFYTQIDMSGIKRLIESVAVSVNYPSY